MQIQHYKPTKEAAEFAYCFFYIEQAKLKRLLSEKKGATVMFVLCVILRFCPQPAFKEKSATPEQLLSKAYTTNFASQKVSNFKICPVLSIIF